MTPSMSTCKVAVGVDLTKCLYCTSQLKGLQVVATLFNNTCNLKVIRCDKNFKNVFIVDSKISTVDGIEDDLQRS